MRTYLILFILCLMPAASFAASAITTAQFGGQPTLLAFWRADCAPCLIELKILPEIAKAHPEMNLTLVSLQDEATTRKHLPASWPASIPVLFAGHDNDTILKRFGDMRRALPYSVLLDEDGVTCAKHYGLLGTQIADEWADQC